MRRTTIVHEFVEFIPSELKEGTLYISIPYATAVHLCACGCGIKVVTPISPPEWLLRWDGDTVSLHPSIGNWQFPCRSHYWIMRNRVEWARSCSAVAATSVHPAAISSLAPPLTIRTRFRRAATGFRSALQGDRNADDGLVYRRQAQDRPRGPSGPRGLNNQALVERAGLEPATSGLQNPGLKTSSSYNRC